jgi:DNA-binding beta-propeller fold protein YncE
MKQAIGLLICVLLTVNALADYDNGMRYTFVASPKDKSITIIDLHSQLLAETIELETAPGEIEASDRLGTLVVAHPGATHLTLIDLSSSKLKQIKYELEMVPDHIKLNPIGDAIAVYDKSQQAIQIFNLRRRMILARFENIPNGDLITFNRDGQQIFWVNREDGMLHSSDLWQRADSIKLTEDGSGLSAMTRSVEGSMGFISDSNEAKVYVVNLRDMRLIKTVRTGKGPRRAWGTSDGQYMIIPNYNDGTITAISTFTFEPLFTIKAIEKPIAINTGWLDTTAAVIGEDGDLALINLDRKQLLKTLQLHGTPMAGVVTSNSRTFALPVSGNGDLYLFDMKSLSLEERISGLPKDLGKASLAISNNLCH